MKKVKHILTLVLVFVSASIFAQVDSAQVASLNNGAETGLTLIFNMLVKQYPVLAPFTGILIGLIMAIVRRIEKNMLKKKIAAEIKTINEAHPVNSETSLGSVNHRNLIQKLVDKLEGKKR